jgi:hypothetical protein
MKQDYMMNNSSGLYSAGSASSSMASFDSSMHHPTSYNSMLSAASQNSFNGARFNVNSKPDTPPAKPCGLWLDPVWNCDNNNFLESRNNGGGASSAGVTADSVKGFNFHVVSPFLSFKTMFTFDNPNQSN